MASENLLLNIKSAGRKHETLESIKGVKVMVLSTVDWPQWLFSGAADSTRLGPALILRSKSLAV